MGKDKRKPIVELDGHNGKVKMFWPSGKEAAEYYNISAVLISYVVNGRQNSAKKKYFRYATDEEIKAYHSVNQLITESDANSQPEPEQIKHDDNITVETIPEKVEKSTNEPEKLSPFEELLKKGKEKFI